MKIAITGSHGLVSTHLVPKLETAGHQVVPMVRGTASTGEIHWDPAKGELDAADLEGVDAVIHLAGVGIFKRWSDKHKRAVYDSRIDGTTLLASRLATLTDKPKVFLSGSAVGWYGDRGDEVLTEADPAGGGFLADLVQHWEGATAPASEAGIRTVFLRTGIVCTKQGGALGLQLPIFKLGVGGKLGSGKQWMSWISIDDEIGGIIHALENEDVVGPLNLTAPNPVTNADFTKTLGRVLHRPTALTVPSFAIRTALGGEMADEMLLVSQRVRPATLEATGYRFAHPDLTAALTSLLDR